MGNLPALIHQAGQTFGRAQLTCLAALDQEGAQGAVGAVQHDAARRVAVTPHDLDVAAQAVHVHLQGGADTSVAIAGCSQGVLVLGAGHRAYHVGCIRSWQVLPGHLHFL